ncbi:MAG TPA: DNA methyltransferase [Candidatus Marinimicrobia bacterium]|nr:DNA methyltransferase [Candidatus Neomarinimicrobiota bacterium]HRS51169.1 DNA methyltransferase [Candidatus Neomarinimicrobiota bacterium]HRU91592.1 DNA methyltransferase [Candidatus Neomarinimicrobiota bacterium]
MTNEIEYFKGEKMLKRADELDFFWAYHKEELPKDKQLVLLDNVQFIYELALAQLELQSLGVNFKITNSLREFKLLERKDEEELRRKLAYFKFVNGHSTDYFQIIQKNRTRSVNQYLTHWIYPYKGKFHPQMIRALLNIIGLKQGDTVLDPFIGSGTTAVEAQLLGINCIGIDVSPLCILQSKVKTESIDVISQILELKEEIIKSIKPSLFNVEGKTIDDVINMVPNEKVQNFYKMAKLVAISDNARRGKEFSKAFLKNIEVMISSVSDFVDIVKELNLKLGKIDIKTGDSRTLPLSNETIDGIVTSPPYSIALDYVLNDAHALKELGYNLPVIREKFIGVRGKGQIRIDLYNNDMKKSLEEMFRVLKPQKYAVIVIGNATYMGQEIKTVEFTIDYAKKIGFKLVKNIDKIIFGLYNVMQKENILIFQKGGDI